MNQKISEYDAFGPWIYEIDDRYPIPPVFDEHVDRSKSALMLIKIPVDAERRSLKPGMIMYDCVIGLYEDYLHLLRYDQGAVNGTRIAYTSLIAVGYSIDLLRGEFDIHAKEGCHTVKFNSASEPVMQKLTRIIRDKITHGSDNSKIEEIVEIDDDFGFFFNGLAAAIKRRESGLRIIGYHGQTAVRYRKRGVVELLFELILRPCLAGTLHLRSGKELVIITRGNAGDFRRYPIHKYGYLYIPSANIDGIAKRASSEFRDVTEYSIRAGNLDFTIHRHESCRGLSYLDGLCK